MLPLRGTELGALPPPGADMMNTYRLSRIGPLQRARAGDIHRADRGQSGAAAEHSHGP